MKKAFLYSLAIALVCGASSCRKDNYDAPGSTLSGRLMYQGTPVEVEYNQVSFDLFEYGFGSIGPISSTFAPDGSYSHLLFNGEYKFVIRNGQGPFLWGTKSGGQQDTMSITVNGTQTLDIEVRPFYMVRNPQITGNASSVTCTFDLEKVITDADAKDIQYVALYVNKTTFVSGADQINTRTEIAGSALTSMTGITMTTNIPSITPSQNYVFGRIGVKMQGVEDLIFSPVVKISF